MKLVGIYDEFGDVGAAEYCACRISLGGNRPIFVTANRLQRNSIHFYHYYLQEPLMQTELTYFEELIEEGSKVQVLCQTDPAFNAVANQCSWCSTQFVLHRADLLAAFQTDRARFADIYNSCLAVGTELRRQHGQLPCGENADNEAMLGLTLKDLPLLKLTYAENEFILPQLAPFIPPFALQEFNGRKHTPLPELKLPQEWDFAMLGRHGQTFVVLPLGEKFLVLDSHVHFAGVMDWKNLLRYIKMEKGALSYGYLFVTMVGGSSRAP